MNHALNANNRRAAVAALPEKKVLPRVSKTSFAIVAVATIATTWLVLAGQRLESLYLSNYGYFYDAAAYHQVHIDLYHAFLRDGLWTTVLNQLLNNDRGPLRTIPYLLLAPKLLTSPTGHLWTAAPFLWLFLFLFCSTAQSSTKSLLLSVCATTFFVGIPFLYDPTHGIAAFWLDLTAALALGSAALCLIRFAQSGNNGWMVAFGALASATVLSRWSAAAYLVTFASLALPAALATRLPNWKNVGTGIACALLTALPGIIFTVYFFKSASHYYRVAGYALNATVAQSLQWAASTLNELLGTTLLCCLLLMAALNAACWMKNRTSNSVNLIALWMPVSFFVFLCLVCKVGLAHHPLFYFAPALAVAAFCPLAPVVNRKKHLALCVTLLTVGVSSSISSYEHFRRIANNPPSTFKMIKQTDVALAQLIASTQARSFLRFDTQSVFPCLEAFYTYGSYCNEAPYFSVHPFHLTSVYPGKTPEQVAVAAYAAVKSNVDLIVVFANPEQALAPHTFSNPYSQSVSREVARRVPNDSSWQLVGTVSGWRGKLKVYKNETLQLSGSPTIQ
jgi:hypothetical protein